VSSPVSIQTQSLALRALRKRKQQGTQSACVGKQPIMVAIASTIGWRLHLLPENASDCV